MAPGGAFNSYLLNSSSSSSAGGGSQFQNSSSSSSSSTYARARQPESLGDLLLFGSGGRQLRDFSQHAGDAMAESISMSNNADDEAFRKTWSDIVGKPTTILHGGPNDGENVMLAYSNSKRHRHNNGNLVGKATDYSSDFAHSQRPGSRNPTPKADQSKPAAARPPLAPPALISPPTPLVVLTQDARTLRQRIITHFANEYATSTLVCPDPLVGTHPDGPLAVNLVNCLNSLANVVGMDIMLVIAKLRLQPVGA